MQMHNFLPQSKLSGVNLFDLKFSACASFSNKLYGMLVWRSSNTIFPLKFLLGFFPNSVRDNFLTNGGDVSNQTPF